MKTTYTKSTSDARPRHNKAQQDSISSDIYCMKTKHDPQAIPGSNTLKHVITYSSTRFCLGTIFTGMKTTYTKPTSDTRLKHTKACYHLIFNKPLQYTTRFHLKGYLLHEN